VSSISLANHLHVNQYGSFRLTDALRPGLNVPIQPSQGYRLESFRDPISRVRIPTLSASVSADHLFDLFLELLDPLGELAHVVLESSHCNRNDDHEDHRRSHIDVAILQSTLFDFEDLILNDGCTGIGVIRLDQRCEVQMDEHKQIYIYGDDLKPFRRILHRYGVERVRGLRLLSEAEHLHHTMPHFQDQFQQLACRLGVGDFESVMSDDGDAFA
jgi:hypothetical protein